MQAPDKISWHRADRQRNAAKWNVPGAYDAVDWNERKTCSRCKRARARSSFPRNATKADGLGHYCHDCANDSLQTPAWRAQRQAYEDRNRDALNAAKRAERKANSDHWNTPGAYDAIAWTGRKRCTRCKRERAKTSYWRSRSRGDGLQPYCKDCAAAGRRP